MDPVTEPELSAFTTNGPWRLDLSATSWALDGPALRRRAQQRVPGATRRRAVPPVGRLVKAGLVLGWAVARWAVTDRRKDKSTSRAGLSRRVRDAFVVLGPTYIKLGQIISAAQGLLPEELVDAFSVLRDRVPAESFDHVRAIVEEAFGRPLEAMFSEFSTEPIAAASIAQVHFATLMTGEQVAVKVQRPRIGDLVEADLKIMTWIAPHLAKRIELMKIVNLPAIIEVFAETIVEELDFRLEAGNMIDVATVLDTTGHRTVVVPRPHPTLVTERVLVMERLSGFAFDDGAAMVAAGVDTTAVVRALMVSLLEGAVIHGVFHGDLHPGNLLVQADGRVALLDHGITGRLDATERTMFLKVLLSSFAGDHRGVLEGYQGLGALPPGTDLDQFLAEVPIGAPSVDPSTAQADELVAEMRRVTKAMIAHGLRIPKVVVLYLKDVMFVDAAIGSLAPDLNLLAEFTFISAYFASTYGTQIAEQLGIDPTLATFDPEALLTAVGMDPTQESLTPRQIRAQRAEVSEKIADAPNARRRFRS